MAGLLDELDPYAGGYSLLEDPFEVAARRRNAPYRDVINRPQTAPSNMSAVADALVPRDPVDYALMLAGGPLSRAAKVALVAGAGALSSDEAQAGPIGSIRKAGANIRGIIDPIREAYQSKTSAGILAAEKSAPFPQYAEAYPPVGAGVPALDKKSGKPYMQKQLTPDAEEFQRVRAEIQKDMDKNGYTPYFDPQKRFHADFSKYPAALDTAQQLPAKMETIEKWTRELDTPETRAALQRMYKAGQNVKDADNWYMMGQVEARYIQEFGPKIGRERFRNDFAGAMAATTGGADPTANFLMGHYANYLRNKGQDFPRWSAADNESVKTFAESSGKKYVDKKNLPIDKTGDIASFKLPFPIGGQYASGNLDQYGRVFSEVARGKDIGQAMVDANPKRLDFMQSFTGNPHSFTWDKQMTTGATAGKYDMPPVYGVMESMARDEASKAGVAAQNFQDVGWAGQKAMLEGAKPLSGGFHGPTGLHNFKYEGPMISHINDAIERTHRLTGMPRDEIVRRGIVRAEIPIYGAAGLLGLGALQQGSEE